MTNTKPLHTKHSPGTTSRSLPFSKRLSSTAKVVLQLAVMAVMGGFAAAAGFEVTLSPDGSSTVPAGEERLINVTYNWPSLSQTLTAAKIEIPLPPEYDGNPANVQLLSSVHVASTNYNPGTRLITYTMVNPLPAGSSGTFKIGLRYPNGVTPNGTAVPVTATATAVGQPSNTSPVTLTASATDKVTISKVIGAPPALNENATYLIQVRNNQGNGNYNLNSTIITDTLPAGAQFVSASSAGSYNPGTNQVTWNLNVLDTTEDVTLRVTVKFPPPGFALTNNVVNNVGLGATLPLPGNPPATRTASVTSVISPPNPSGVTSKSVSDSISSLKAYLTYTLGVRNAGNVELSNYILEDSFPAEFIPTTLYIGSDNNDAETATIAVQYQTTLNPAFVTAAGSPFTATPGSDIAIDVSSLAGGAVVTGVRYTYTALPVGYDTAWRSRVSGTVGNQSTGLDRNGAVIAPLPRDPVINTVNYSYNFNGGPTVNGTSSANTRIIEATPKPQVSKSISRSSAQPTDTINFYSEVRNTNGSLPLTSPVWADLLPAEVEYTTGTFTVGNQFAPFVPANLTVTPNYNGTGRTLLRYAATGASINAFQNGSISFDVKVKPGTVVGNYSNTAYLVSTTSPVINPEYVTPEPDTSDLDADLNTTETIYPSNPTPFTITRYAAVDSYKVVKGELDTVFHRAPITGLTNANGTFVYKLTVTNPGNVPLNNIKIMDVLPFVGDVGVLLTSANRDSEFTPYLTSVVTAPPGITVSYSTSRNPKRTDLDPALSDPPGAAGTFSPVAPVDLTTVGSLLFDFGTIVLAPLETRELTWTMTAPTSVIPGDIAWNSFGFRAGATDGGTPPPPSEPIKVGVTVPATGASLIGDQAWFDTNGNDINDSGESGVPNLLVGLCDSLGQPVLDIAGNPVTTTTDSNGFYQFGVPAGTYSVKFASPPGYGPTLRNAPGSTTSNDSDIDSTGKTGNVTVALNSQNLTLDAGFANFANLGNVVFCDLNNNGIRDLPGDVGISNVELSLLDSAGNAVDNPNLPGVQPYTVTTNGAGEYRFVNLIPGTYQVKILTPPVDKPASSTTTDTADNQQDDDDNGSQTGPSGPITSPLVVLSPGETDDTLDFGLFLPAHIGNYVWFDTDKDGLLDLNETQANGVTVQLFKAGQNPAIDPPFMTTTTAGGLYNFDVAAGDYFICIPALNFTAPNGPLATAPNASPVAFTLDNQTDNNNNGTQAGGSGTAVKSNIVNLTAGETDHSIDFGFPPLQICGKVFRDENDLKDDLVNGTDPNLSGQLFMNLISGGLVTQTFPVPGSGLYNFTGIYPNTNYTLVLTSTPGTIGQPAPAPSLPEPYVHTGEVVAPTVPQESQTDGTLSLRVITSDVCNADFGIDVAKPSIQLEKFGYIDLGTNGQVEASDLIRYSFRVVNTGNVRLTNVTITDPTATSISGGPIPMLEVNAIDTTTFTGTYSITAGDLAAKTHSNTATVVGTDPKNNPVRDTSTHVEDLSLYKLCGTVFSDSINHNGSIDNGDTPVANIPVSLYLDRNNDGIPDGPAVVTVITQTGIPGYCFPNLPVGNYITCHGSYPGATNITDVDGNTNGRNCVHSTIVNADVLNRDFLIDGVKLCSIMGQVTDGVNPLPGTTIRLFNANGVLLGEVVTDVRGRYRFSHLPDGGYEVVEENPVGTQGGSDVDNNDPDKIVVRLAGADQSARDFLDLIVANIPERNICTYCRTQLIINPSRGIPARDGAWTVLTFNKPKYGTVTLRPDGWLQYIPRREFYGNIEDLIVVTLRDGSGFTLTKTIRVRTFESLSGTFQALLQPESMVDEEADPRLLPAGAVGMAQVTLTRNATVSGKVVVEGETLSFVGPLTGELSYRKTFRTNTGFMRLLTFSFNDVTDTWSLRLQGMSTEDLVSRLLRGRSAALELAGTYTIAFGPFGAANKTSGYAVATVSRTGTITLTGEMVWGGTFALSGRVLSNGLAVFYWPPGLPTAKKRQVLALMLDLANTATTHELTGTADWRFQDSLLGGGMTPTPQRLNALGSQFIPIGAKDVLLGSPTALIFTMDDGSTVASLPSIALNTASLQTSVPGPESFRLMLNRKTGVWSGTLSHAGATQPLRGVTLQSRQRAEGFGLTPTQPQLIWRLGP